MTKKNPLIGKVPTSVWLEVSGGAIRFDFADGESIVARSDGDCCSYTWIESVDAPEVLVGSPIVAVEDIPMPNLGNGNAECTAYYGCKITTARGVCVIDYRNESNGYYGGNLSWPGEYFYGGVHDQNGKIVDWRKIA